MTKAEAAVLKKAARILDTRVLSNTEPTQKRYWVRKAADTCFVLGHEEAVK